MTAEIYKNRILSDPFAVEPLPKAFYFPSPEKKLTKNEKSVAISPRRRADDEHNGTKDNSEKLNPLDEHFLQASHSYRTKLVDSPEVDLDESWPTSERPSSVSLPGLDDSSLVSVDYKETVDRFLDLKKTLVFPDRTSATSEMKTANKGRQPTQGRVKKTTAERDSGPKAQQSKIPLRNVWSKQKAGQKDSVTKTSGAQEREAESVLQKYIERFRNSEPKSRDERARAQDTSSGDFWWLESNPPTPSDSSTPVRETTAGKTSRRFTPLSTENLARYDKQAGVKGQHRGREPVVPQSPGERRTRELQERAERLLERSSSTVVSTDPAVSTEGLGSNVSSQDSLIEPLDEYPVRPKFAYFSDITDGRRMTAGKSGRGDPPPARPPHSDEDILQQWRLKRRMDQARSGVPVQTPSFGFLNKNEQQKKIDAKLEEFKRKLAGKEDSSATPRPSVAGVNFTPAPQTGQSHSDKRPVSPSQVETSQRATRQSEPVIASPLLKPKVTEPEPGVASRPEVNPHLHLMCDLIPCPHQGQYLQKFANLRISSEGLGGDNEGTVGNKDPPQYKQFLQAEKPDVERPAGRQSDRSPRQPETEEKKARKLPTEPHDVPPVMESLDSDDFMKDASLQDKSLAAQERSEEDSDTHYKQKKATRDKPHESISSSSRSVKFREELMDRPKHREVTKRSEGRGHDESRDVPRPQPASSPKLERRPVEDTIGQVVKNRLFNLSTSTVLSSVESLPPVTSLEQPEPLQARAESPQGVEISADVSGDSEGEFEDDQLLNLLRQQRQQYEQQLHEIDALLESLEDR